MAIPGEDIGKTSVEVRKLLDAILINQVELYRKTKHFYDTNGAHSFLVHNRSFSDQFNELNESINEVRSRICKLGYRCEEPFTVSDELLDARHEKPSFRLIKDLLEDHEALIGNLQHSAARCKIQNNDIETADLLNGLLKKHELVAWTLRKYLNQL
ncbi:MAG: starvation/stationary phase protection protein [Bacteroidota bacterium]|jgi:DNA-binding ferritin-like protein|nr:starvation/stationary phase protection protein [Bacteroidota bacterium]